MSILRHDLKGKDQYRICIDLDSIGSIQKHDDPWKVVLNPCRFRAVKELYDQGHYIILVTNESSDKESLISPQLEYNNQRLPYHEIIYNHVEADFYVSEGSRQQLSFFDELFDRNYEIKPLGPGVVYN